MEAMGAFFDEEWDSLSKMFFSEDADLMFQLNGEGNLVIPNHESVTTGSFLAAAPSFFWPSSNGGNYNENVDVINDILDYNISQESSNSSTSSASEGVFVNPTQEFDHQTNYDYINLLQVTNDSSDQSMDFCNLMDQRNIISSFINLDNVMEDIIICPRDDEMEIEKRVNAEIQQPAKSVDESVVMKRKFQTEAEEKTNDESSLNPKKKSRVARNAPKAKRNVQPKSKKRQKAKEISNEEEEPNMNGQSSCSYNSEDDSNASQESNGGETSDTKAPAAAALNLNGKARATRGAATDPQSLYARRRRERINERLRILQNLIPNGTKVDISTMLEEAVQYVKFMQLQIKLLSSDDKWMYAPIVYNGFDISLFGKIFPTL